MTTPPQQQQGYPTASAAASASLAAGFHSAQALMAAVAIRDVLAIWQQLDLRDIKASWPVLRTGIAGLIGDRFALSAAAGGQYYAQARSAAGVPGPAPVVTVLPVSPTLAAAARLDQAAYAHAVAESARAAAQAAVPVPPLVSIPPPPQPLITATLDSTGPFALLARIQQGQPLPQAAENTGVVMSGAATRLIQNGARQAIVTLVQKDSKAVAWMRVLGSSRTGPCAFCSMLASRGPVYKSEATAMAFWHNLCKCTPQPVFSERDAEALKHNDLYEQWKDVTKGFGRHDAFLAWRRYWDRKTSRDGIRVLPAA